MFNIQRAFICNDYYFERTDIKLKYFSLKSSIHDVYKKDGSQWLVRKDGWEWF